MVVGKNAVFERVDSGLLEKPVYLMVATRNLRDRNLSVEALQAKSKILEEKHVPVAVLQGKSSIEIKVSAFAEASEYINKGEWLDHAIERIELKPKDEPTLVSWRAAIAAEETRRAYL